MFVCLLVRHILCRPLLVLISYLCSSFVRIYVYIFPFINRVRTALLNLYYILYYTTLRYVTLYYVTIDY